MSQAIRNAVDQGGSLTSLCQMAGISRAQYYRHLAAPELADTDTALREHIQRVALDCSCYGYRRVTKELHRQGIAVNHKRVLRLMREDNLLCLRKRRFVATTDSDHGLPVYPNLAADMDVTAPDVLWVSDLTYIRLGHEFVYLAVVLDACSRRCLGWALGRRLDAALATSALRMALTDGAEWPKAPGSSFGSWRPVRFGRVHASAQRQWHCDQHESKGESLRQRQGRKLHEDAQV